MAYPILIVDDDANALAAYKRQLRQQFHIEVAQEGEAALTLLDQQGPFAVVVADRAMPGMDGIQFLARVRERSPETVRIMLTGNIDLQGAVDAVNEGYLFRFLTKPCSPDALARALQAGVEQYWLITAQRELLRHTLITSIKTLIDLMGILSPVAFSRAMAVREYARHIADQLQLPDVWQLELAALLSQIGCVALPPALLQKVYNGEALSDSEQKLYANHPLVGSQLLERIPHLEMAARMVAGLRDPFGAAASTEDLLAPNTAALGTKILYIVLEYDRLTNQGLTHAEALADLRQRVGKYGPRLIAALESLPQSEAASAPERLRIIDLTTRMTIAEPIYAQDGACLAAKGQIITELLLERIHNFSASVGVREPICVRRDNQ